MNLKDKVSTCTNSVCHTKKLQYWKANDQNDHYIPKYSDKRPTESYQNMTLDESCFVKSNQGF